MEETPQQTVPAGWYPDPKGEGLRYWDGKAWTEHTAPAAAAAEAAQPAASAPQPAQPSTPSPAPQAASGPHTAHSSDARDQPTTTEWVLSVALPLIPLAGLIWGVYLRRQGGAKENPGNVAVIFSLVVILVLVLTLR